ncbi:GH1 family beta-glucosidase [Ideonella sp. BN130291]|uniref:GH1 family beta-glucosidase n=1 Tax=Ideonella sp. BN130291 TaxID=3112940 RepID=UPI002E26AFE7|nr:GH1 family beta-glucosidase [Ideonella sp. BN130291]
MPSPNDLHLRFPPGFRWGVATSAFQIEGAAFEDGRGESIWDRFCHQPGAIADGSHGDVACDHYHRWESDLDLIASLGVTSYRFSVSWPRVLPTGSGAWNPKGMAFYERLVDGLLARGIEPCLTLNHWDLPQALQERGGWAARDTMHRFVDYARGVQRHLGDRVRMITTHNEPWVIAILGHEFGTFAPGIKSRKTAYQVAHHLLVSHGLALEAMRADGAKAPLGIVLNLAHTEPATSSAADAARVELDEAMGRRWYTDALFKGRYPQLALDELGADAPRVEAGDMAHIATPMDYLGINYYSRHVASADNSFDAKKSGLPLTAMGWEIYPRGLTGVLTTLHHEYELPPVYITENGAAFDDHMDGGKVHDADRIDYLRGHIGAVADAMERGVPVAGYMVWSLMDNFEWASGYAKRFGIVHVDYATQQRAPKDSGLWYRDLVRACRERSST